jgi:hypothetical protein
MVVMHPRPAACDCARTYVSLELDGELSELELRLLSAHLDRCESCRVYRDDVRTFTTGIREAAFEAPSRRVRIPARVKAELPIHQLGAVAAALVVLVGTSTLLTPSADNEQRVHGAPEFHQSSPNEVGFVVGVNPASNYAETASKRRSTGVDFIV